jgi:hypothetical protein
MIATSQGSDPGAASIFFDESGKVTSLRLSWAIGAFHSLLYVPPWLNEPLA